MKLAATLAAATAMLAAAPSSHAQRQVTPDGQPIDRTADEACRDRIEQVRAERGLPTLERRTASPDEPLFFTALDYRIDGCGALVMKSDTSDIRPVPPIADSRPLLMPAR